MLLLFYCVVFLSNDECVWSLCSWSRSWYQTSTVVTCSATQRYTWRQWTAENKSSSSSCKLASMQRYTMLEVPLTLFFDWSCFLFYYEPREWKLVLFSTCLSVCMSADSKCFCRHTCSVDHDINGSILAEFFFVPVYQQNPINTILLQPLEMQLEAGVIPSWMVSCL